MRTADVLTASFLLLVGGVVIYDAVRLGIGWGTDGPKSGFFPFWLALIMVVTCGVIVLQAVRRPGMASFVTRERLWPVLAVLWPALAMVLLTHVVGLYVASAVYIAFYMRWIGRHRWPTLIAVALLIPIVTFVVFELWFLVPMPKGPLEAWLGH